MKPSTLACAVGLLLAATGASAHVHLGQKGTVWTIAEPDMRVVIAEQAAAAMTKNDPAKKLKNQAEGWLEYQPGVALPVARKTSLRTFTPSFTLKEDKLYLKEEKDGSWKWTVLYPKGTVVYPLRASKPQSWLFIFDADNAAQTTLAGELAKVAEEAGKPIKLIATGGHLKDAMEKTKRYVYLMPSGFLASIPVEETPSLVGVRNWEDDFLTIATQIPPYNAKLLAGAVWNAGEQK